MAVLRILVADDHPAVRRTIRSLVESQSSWMICGEAANGREAIEKTRELQPDVVLLDMTMPEIDGLEATRQILKESPRTEVFILTTHQSPELTQEVMRAGARATILKSNAEAALVSAMESLRDGAVHLAGSPVGRCKHIAAFFRSQDERMDVLRSFYAEGLQHGDKQVHIIEPPSVESYVSRLQDADIDVRDAIAKGELELHSWEKMYLLDGFFDQDAMLGRFRDSLARAVEAGYARTRVVGHMEWALEERPGVRQLAEYEARLNDLIESFDVVVVCTYEIRRFAGDVTLDILRSHPAVVIDGAFQDNRFFVPPDRLRAEIRGRA